MEALEKEKEKEAEAAAAAAAAALKQQQEAGKKVVLKPSPKARHSHRPPPGGFKPKEWVPKAPKDFRKIAFEGDARWRVS